jgi:hypothetical protein
VCLRALPVEKPQELVNVRIVDNPHGRTEVSRTVSATDLRTLGASRVGSSRCSRRSPPGAPSG